MSQNDVDYCCFSTIKVLLKKLLLQRTLCCCTEQRETTVRVVVSETSQAVAAASPTDEDVIARQQRLDSSLAWMIYHFLVHVIDIKRGNLIDKLVAKDVLSSYEKERIKKLKKADDKVNSLLIMLKAKSAADFDNFLATLSETGQQSVADVVRYALHTAGQTGHNPLHVEQIGKQTKRILLGLTYYVHKRYNWV